MPFYAVAKGREVGIFNSWDKCRKSVHGYGGAKFKKFKTKEEANTFIVDAQGTKKRKATLDEELLSKECCDKEKFCSELEISSGKKRKHANEEGTSDVVCKKLKLDEAVINENGFFFDSFGFLCVYTDGSAFNNGRRGAKAGIGVYFGHNHPMNLSEPVKGRPTNNTAEILAATRALQLAKTAGFDKVKIRTDSQFMINCVKSWVPKWKKNGWKKADGSKVINKDDLIKLINASEGMNIQWKHVSAHVGVEGNEGADALARKGAEKYVSHI